MILFFSLLDEKQRRLYAGLEAVRLGYGGDRRAAELAQYRIHLSPNTVGRLLKGLDFRLRVNFKTIESGNRKPPDPRKRDEQF